MQTPLLLRRQAAVLVLVALVLGMSSFRSYRMNAVRVKWTMQLVKISDTDAELRFTAQIPGGWHMFSQTVPEVNGPMPIHFEFDGSDAYEAVGGTIENGKVTPVYEPAIVMQVNSLEGQVTYTQKV
ncbi:MAG: hypothetical protein ACRC3B_17210 [Bacteroidia bacterium]